MNVYIAGCFEDLERLKKERERVRALGAEVVGTWLDEEVQPEGAASKNATEVLTPEQALEYAERDITEIGLAEVLALDTLGTNIRGGREVEFGYAYALDCVTIVVGPKRNVFHELADFHAETWDDALAVLKTYYYEQLDENSGG